MITFILSRINIEQNVDFIFKMLFKKISCMAAGYQFSLE